MSAEGDQQRRPGAPDDTDGKRRLRAVSYPDPYLVTKLPLEATVNSGVIRLGERMLLGFIHRPYPDGTRVRVVYDEWLFAERLEEDRGGDEGDEEGEEETKQAAAKGTRKRGKAGSPKSSGKARAEAGKGKGSRQGQSKGHEASERSPAEEEADQVGRREVSHDSHSANRFPEDFYDQERRASGELDGAGDPWTETFERNERDD